MNQYCRYCANCFLQDDDIVYCEPKKQMREKKECTRINKCKHFEFNPFDVFSADEHGNFKEYKPRGLYKPKREQIKESGQLQIESEET